MKTRNSTKSKLLSSVIALVLCVSMLIGATFAWFTDAASTGVNKIQAGNLDVEVEYSTNGTNWATIENANTLFSQDLWEPGHTEFVYLRVKNAGSLALKYKVIVSPVSETGGINKAGQPFKLSDYLVFGITAPNGSCPSFGTGDVGRQTARDAVGTGMRLADGLTQTGKILANRADQYLALVVYMPESVGNDANYKPGTIAPEINLGVTVYATQLNNESDSFDSDYDASAPLDQTNRYNFSAQTTVSGTLTKNEEGTMSSESNVTVETNGDVTIAKDVAKVTIPGAAIPEGTSTYALNIVLDEVANANFSSTHTDVMTSGVESKTYEVNVTLNGVKVPETDNIYRVVLDIGANKENFKMYHDGTLMSEAAVGSIVADTYEYDPSTGKVTIYVKHFSPFTSVYKEPLAEIGDDVYYSLEAAVSAASADGTILLTANTLKSSSAITVDKNLTIQGVDGSRIEAVIIGKNDAKLKIDNVAFGGKSYIWNQGMSELTLTDCDINVSVEKDYNVNNASWRASFVSLGSSEGNAIKLDIRGNIFVTDTARYWGDDSHGDANGNYTPAIFGWAKIKDGSVISDNVFGASDNRFGFLVVKLMNFEDNATVTIRDNKVYGTTYWGSEFHAFDLYQNTSRANKYTANFSGNTVDVNLVENDYDFVPDNYFLYLEVGGNSSEQTGHATVNIDDENTYNGALVTEDVCKRVPWPNPGTINYPVSVD